MRVRPTALSVALFVLSIAGCKRSDDGRAPPVASKGRPVVSRPATSRPAASRPAATRPATDPRRARAREAVGRLKQALKRELQRALPQGPVKAIEVCQLKAPAVAAALAARGVTVGRTSDRLRNPDNAPSPWMRPLLDRLQDEPAPAPGARPAHHTATLDDGRLAYVEAIYVQPVCTTCHGKPDSTVAAVLAKRYPEDRATGYAPGAFRGMFWAVVE